MPRLARASLVLALLTTMGIAYQSHAVFVRPPGRYKVVGPTDPASGVRIEYTVSSHFKRMYKAAIAEWKFRRPSEPKGGADITQTNSKHATMSGLYVDSQGYARIDLKRAKGVVMASVASQELMEIKGCPTTWVIEDSDIVVGKHPMQYHNLLVRPRGQSVTYIFQAIGIEGHPPNPELIELRAIRASLRVVRK